MHDKIIEFADKITNPVLDILGRLPQAILTLVGGILLIQISAGLLEVLVIKQKKLKPFHGIILSIFKTLTRIGLILFVMNSLGFSKLAAVITGSSALLMFFLSAGAAGIVGDVIAGVSLASDTDFRIGSKVKAGDKETVGIVSSTDMRKVRIRDEEGHMHVIPNALIEKNEWVVLKKASEVAAQEREEAEARS
ncbi:MAG: Small-conductance mechanosensitive channel [candidate division CPR2 bacterium GW2011_GWC1_39_9]|uniref:Small-conductance mechanosensitive channel n=1 Tax=candidate division CPR2 bacterium GW2011_GWC2_39_10 TaxID=1618345 RepID=A0A0G0PVQ2_UNCC2|nr:MAG: Small-conductance mechanosensitive channel [candidate division CPR2 bacterium GW2011_GWC2_39_10]KKR33135.1 MAG: Small-conductance mechanosensitive channel [candidate division CPR2 bacterium GW2011_GWC1_39_9]